MPDSKQLQMHLHRPRLQTYIHRAYLLALNGIEDSHFPLTMVWGYTYYVAVPMNRQELLDTASENEIVDNRHV